MAENTYILAVIYDRDGC